MRATELHIPEPCSCLRSQIAYQMIGSHTYFSADPTEPTDNPYNNDESRMSGVRANPFVATTDQNIPPSPTASV
jgi:hypothetical protein